MQLIYTNDEKKKVIALIDAPDVKINTKQQIFTGTYTECMDEIKHLNLTLPKDEDPFLVERIFKIKKEHAKQGKVPLMLDDDILPYDTLPGVKVHEDKDYAYMKCTIPKDMLQELFKNSQETDVTEKLFADSKLSNVYKGKSKKDLEYVKDNTFKSNI